MTADIKDYFLATPIDKPEYMTAHIKHIPEDIRLKYNLHKKITSNDYVYIKIKKGMCGLKQAAFLAYNSLQHSLKPF